MFNRKAWQKEYNKKHKKRIQQYHKHWYQMPENKAKVLFRGKTPHKKRLDKIWRELNREHLKTYMDNYRKSPKGIIARKKYQYSSKAKACRKRFFLTDRGKFHKKIYATKRYLQTTNLTIATIQQVYENNIKKNGTLTCYLCFTPISFGKDNLEHKIPLSRDGNNKKSNLDIACRE